MASSSSSSFAVTDRKTVIGELTRGRETAEQLRLILRGQIDPSSGATASALPARGLVGKILDSFTRSISILRTAGDSDEVSQIPTAFGLKLEDSGESCKTPAPKDLRGCYKRRRTSETWIKESPTLFDDGYAWRKYGQKVILNAEHPRNYMRCTHKFDQGCQASKQVQKIEDDPPLYRTTYHGQHSCKIVFKSLSSREVIVQDSSSSIVWSFQGYKPEAAHHHRHRSPSIKRENKEEDIVKSPKFDRECFVLSLETCSRLGGAFSSADVISPDVYSCIASTRTAEMDMMVGGSVFDDFLEFESI